jgi:splicing factor 3B subunit 5
MYRRCLTTKRVRALSVFYHSFLLLSSLSGNRIRVKTPSRTKEKETRDRAIQISETDMSELAGADRFNINSQLEALQTRYVGTGHADTSKYEWIVNQHRDSLAQYVGKHSMLQYFALAENESTSRVAYEMKQKMLLPCGLPPPPAEDDDDDDA